MSDIVFTNEQGLNDFYEFCRKRVAEMRVNQKNLEANLDNKALSDFDREIVREAYCKNIGYQLAFREITEWAAKNTIEIETVSGGKK